MLRLAIAALAACVLFALVPAGAMALKYKTTVRLTEGGPEGAKGKVKSPKPGCLRKRKVELFRENEVDPDEPQSYGTDRTNRRGAFGIDMALLAGDYYARVSRRVLPNGDVCKPAVSLHVRF
jgi:hypothetical protein